MPKQDESHFDDYSPQNEAKHWILKQYLTAYVTALKKWVSRYHFIDGFAGRGLYGDAHVGSPILAIQVLDELGVTANSTISCVENNLAHFGSLAKTLASTEQADALLGGAFCESGKFHDHVDAILDRDIYRSGKVATLSFVDPCGVDGMHLSDLVRLIEQNFGEVLLFFNYDGFNRLLGGYLAGTHDRRVLVEMLGSTDRLAALIESLDSAESTVDREVLVRDSFVEAIRSETGARFFVPFRFDSRRRERTSHYLIHCCKHPLGFKIMKHVMWSAGKTETDPYGSLDYPNDRERGSQFRLLRSDILEQKARIVERIRQGACKVSTFTRDWHDDPNDMFSEQAYKTMLIELESAGNITVYSKDNTVPAPQSDRQQRKGKPTLADGYWLRDGNG